MKRSYVRLTGALALCALLVLVSCSNKPERAEQPAAAAPQATAAPAAPAPRVAPAAGPSTDSNRVAGANVESRRVRPSEPKVANAPAAPKTTPVAAAPAPERPAAPAVPVEAPVSAPRVPAVAVNPEPPVVPSQPVAPQPSRPDEPVARVLTIPSGALIPIRMIDAVDSKTDRVGQTFRASIDEDVIVKGETALRKGGDAYVKLTRVQSAGSVNGKSELQLQLDRIVLETKTYKVESNVFQTEGPAQSRRAARNVGIGAAIGAAIGAIAGGGKGAAIGATAGAGGGAAATVIAKGEQVHVDSETPLTFRLERPLEITLQ